MITRKAFTTFAPWTLPLPSGRLDKACKAYGLKAGALVFQGVFSLEEQLCFSIAEYANSLKERINDMYCLARENKLQVQELLNTRYDGLT
ncbi:hypothetical protein EVAR_3803_1 [Eumeta japonica]|uniref:Uncharacterized protein n=1 Tax=Eumeta variegata TaxID=151549 RepID=A0A4C1SUM7_EUMVA|nr:hypothetical protein EVAR_3803_1 [Eumeta japonica]